MLDSFCKFLDSLNDTDDGGNKSVLSQPTFDALKDVVASVWGRHSAEVLEDQFDQDDEGMFYTITDKPSEAFMLCMTGRG